MSTDMFPDDFIEYATRHYDCPLDNHDPKTCGKEEE